MTNETHIQVIDRMISLLESLARHEHASLKTLATETNLHSSTAFRILASLHHHNWVVRDNNGGYQLGSGLMRYAGQAAQQQDIREIALPIMTALRDQTGETVNLTQRENDEVVYIERVTSTRMMRVEQVIGSRAPLHVTAVGKLMLGEASGGDCLDYAQRTQLPAYTTNTITRANDLCTAAALAQAQGYALDNEEAELGVGCIGVLIRDAHGKAVAGLSISAPRERRKDEWISALQQAGAAISARLGAE
jgi:DNA-binding IclR family transcriptional regulator